MGTTRRWSLNGSRGQLAFVAGWAMCWAAAAACTGDNPTLAPVTADAAVPDGPATSDGDVPPDAGADAADAADSANVEMTTVRIANLSPDVSALDVCISPHGTNQWIGPLLNSGPTAAGLAYRRIAAYRPVIGGDVDIRVVTTAAIDCSGAERLIDVLDLRRLQANHHYTLVILGKQTAVPKTLAVTAYEDDDTASSDKARLRLINADPDHPAEGLMQNDLDDYEGGGGGENRCNTPDSGIPANCTLLFDPIPFGQTAPASTAVNANGYRIMDPIGMGVQHLFHVPSFAKRQGIAPGIAGRYPIGKVATLFSGSGGALILCDDLDTSAIPFATCTP